MNIKYVDSDCSDCRASIISSGGIPVDKCSEVDEDEQAELEDALEMSNQSHAAKKNQKWKQSQSEAWLQDKSLKRLVNF